MKCIRNVLNIHNSLRAGKFHFFIFFILSFFYSNFAADFLKSSG